MSVTNNTALFHRTSLTSIIKFHQGTGSLYGCNVLINFHLLFSLTDKVTPSQHQNRTPVSSPSQNSAAVKRIWSSPAKLITNPRLRPLSCHIAMVTRSPQSTSRTPPKMQDTLLTSPIISKAYTLKPGILQFYQV